MKLTITNLGAHPVKIMQRVAHPDNRDSEAGTGDSGIKEVIVEVAASINFDADSAETLVLREMTGAADEHDGYAG